MQGGIRNITSLKKWFNTVGSPFFTLSYLGQANHVILRNTAVEDMGEAWDMLETQILAQAEYGRAQMHLITYKKSGGANNPDGRTNIDMQPLQEGRNMAGIGSTPGGYMDESKVQGILDKAREKWELEKRLEDLEAQINSPNDWTEKLMEGIERIGNTPIGQMLAMKFLGAPLPQIPLAPIAGTPATDDEGEADSFENDIEFTASMLGVNDTVLARRLRQMVEQNPELAKQLLSQQ